MTESDIESNRLDDFEILVEDSDAPEDVLEGSATELPLKPGQAIILSPKFPGTFTVLTVELKVSRVDSVTIGMSSVVGPLKSTGVLETVSETSTKCDSCGHY